MICPMCLEKGYATDEDIKEYPHRCPNCNGKGFYSVDWQKVRCEVCNGSGKKPMTNEEYLKSLDTEQLAKRLHDKDVYAFFVCQHGGKVPSVEHYVEWLKEIHHANRS